jgi:hypothetical protein
MNPPKYLKPVFFSVPLFFVFVGCLSPFACTSLCAKDKRAPITVVVVYAELSTAKEAQPLKIPAGTTLAKLIKEGRVLGARRMTMAVQGFVELRRLPNMSRDNFTLNLPMNEVRKTEKANVALEDGDIIIIDLWPDL